MIKEIYYQYYYTTIFGRMRKEQHPVRTISRNRKMSRCIAPSVADDEPVVG